MPFLLQPPENKKLVTIQQATQLVEVSRRTIYKWMYDGKIDYVRNAVGNIRIVEETLWSKHDISKQSFNRNNDGTANKRNQA